MSDRIGTARGAWPVGAGGAGAAECGRGGECGGRGAQAFVALLFVLLHLPAAALVPLVDDEAYYALWADWPSLATYDHPPMVAWLIHLGKLAGGETPLAIRLPFVIAWGGAVFLAGRVGTLATGRAVIGTWSALFAAATVPWMVLGFTATPDGPLALFWTAVMWTVFAWRRTGQGRWPVLGGAFLALALLSKLTAAFLGLGVLFWLVLTEDGRAAFRRPALWFGVGVCALLLVPWLWWNATHGWHGFVRQTARLGEGHFGLRLLVEYLGSQILLVTPLVAWLALRGMARPLAARRHLLVFALPLPLFMLWHSLKAAVLAQWVLPAYPAFAVFAAAEAEGRPRRWRVTALALAFLLAVLAVTLAFRPGPPLFPGNNPPNQTKGWSAVAGDIAAAAENAGARWVATTHYGLAGQLHHHLGRRWPVWDVAAPRRYLFRDPFPQALCAAPALLVARNGTRTGDVRRLFAEVVSLGEAVRRSRGAEIDRYPLFVVRGLKLPALCPGAEEEAASQPSVAK